MALRSRVRPPGDPAVRAKVDGLREALLRASALDRAGQYAAALGVARPLLEAASATNDHALVSEIGFVVGRAEGRLGDFASADAALYDAAVAGEAAQDDVAKARALVLLAYHLGEKEAKYAEAARAGQLAAAVLARWPKEVELRAKLEDDLAFVDDGRGSYESAKERSDRAIALRESAYGKDDYSLAMSYNNRSKHLYLLGDIEQAFVYQKRGLAVLERFLGPHHPDVALLLRNVGLSELDLHHWDDALRDERRALAIWEAVFVDSHASIAMTEGVIAIILDAQGKPGEALPHAERSLSLTTKLLTPDHPDIVNSLNTIGKIYLSLGRAPEAITSHLRAVGICSRLGDPPNETSESLNDVGEAYLHEGQTTKAVAALEHALVLRVKVGDKIELADTRFTLAKALRAAKADDARAIGLAEQARDGFGAKPGFESERDSAARWIATNARGPSPRDPR